MKAPAKAGALDRWGAAVRFVLRPVVTWCWEPAGEVALEPGQIVVTTPVPDVTVGANEVLGSAVDAKAREHLPLEVLQGAGRGRAGQVVHGQRVTVTVVQSGELAGVPVAGRAASGDTRIGKSAQRLAGPLTRTPRGQRDHHSYRPADSYQKTFR
jgi:hypothetical protein